MGKPTFPPPAMLFAGLIYSDPQAAQEAILLLEDDFGRVKESGPEMPFDFTGFYKKEMGTGLVRRWILFPAMIERDALPGIKLDTNSIEYRIAEKYGSAENRKVNIDPGYITAEKLILATTKNSSHRPYLTDGIFAELCYEYIEKSYRPLPWTYPDYKTQEAIALFTAWRQIYASELKYHKRD